MLRLDPEMKIFRRARLFYIKGIEQDLQENCHYPLALYCLKQFALADPLVAERWRIDVEVLDFECQQEQVLHELIRDDVHLVGFSCYLWNYQKSFRLAQKLKLVRGDGTRVVFGGPQVADAARTLRDRPEVDFVCFGEGEDPFRELLKALPEDSSAGDPGDIPGLAFRRGGVAHVPPAAPPLALERLPDVYQPSSPADLSGTVILETSRGCPYGCRFCYWGDTQMRYFPLERVERDIAFVLRQPNVESLFLIDAELDIDRQHAHAVLRSVQRHNVRNIPVSGFLSFARWDEELLALCKSCNFQLGVGIQSLDRRTLDLAGRRFLRREKAERTLEQLEPFYAKDELQLQFILGLPGDSYGTFAENIAWCIDRGYFQLGVNRLFILPGTDFYARAAELGIDYDPGGYHAVYSTPSFSYEDILRAEMLLSGFRLFAHYLSVIPPSFWRERGHEPVEVCARVGETLADRGMCFLGRQENESPEFPARSVAHRAAREVLTDVLRDLLCPEDAIRLEDLVRYLHLRDTCHARVRARRLGDEAAWQAAQLWEAPPLETRLAEFRFDIASFLSDPTRALSAFPLEPCRAFFILNHQTGKVSFVRDLPHGDRWVVEELLRIITHRQILARMGVPREEINAAFVVDRDWLGTYEELLRITQPQEPERSATPGLRRPDPAQETDNLMASPAGPDQRG
jgi:anaerobic magnesium-protoporphyrin IX monomethyl ester cyclase